MKPGEIANLRYFAPDEDYRVRAKFVPVKNGRTVAMKSVNGGKHQLVKEYGYAVFELMSVPLKLHIYKMVAAKGEKNYDLFVPFTDQTNSISTYRGGRYLNVRLKDISDNKVILDFNKAYNPRTAYVKGYPAIVPPRENALHIDINAGEKAYGRDPGF